MGYAPDILLFRGDTNPGGGLTHLVMGRSFGNGAKQGAIGGAIGGGIGGMIGYMMNPGKAGNTAKEETSSQDFLIAAGDDRKVVFGAMISF